MERAERRKAIQIWRRSGLKSSSIVVYLRWVERFKAYCGAASLDESHELTLAGSYTFAQTYAREHNVSEQTAHHSAQCALRAWAVGLAASGRSLPQWRASPAPSKPSPPILAEFAEHLREHRGNPESTIHKQVAQISALLAFLQSRRRQVEKLQLCDIDAFVLRCRERYARTTTAGICSTIRTFLRFLHATGQVPLDLSSAVAAPVVRNNERPRRALPWDDVRRILRPVDRSTCAGRRDYAMLLMMRE